MKDTDLYEVLGVPSTANPDEIRAAYRESVKKHHPDRFLSPEEKSWATQRMQQVNEAFAILGDYERRKQYDQVRNQQGATEKRGQRQEKRLTPAEFVIRAIIALREKPSAGIHSVNSGFNEAFRVYFNDDPVKWINKLAAEGVIDVRIAPKGFMLYLPGEAPSRTAINAMERFYEKVKEDIGTLCWVGFIISWIYLQITNSETVPRFRWSVLSFIIGLFASLVVLGPIFYFVQRLIGKLPIDPFNARGRLLIVALGWLLFVFEIVVIFVATRAFFFLFYSVPAPAKVFEVPGREYVDHQYQFGFQFPEDWKIEKNPPPGEAGEVRAIVRHPTKPMRVMAAVSRAGKSIEKLQFESIPRASREAIVEAFAGLTVERVYKKASRDMGAESMVVFEKRTVPSEAGVSFYISTLHLKDKIPILVAGIHIVPFEKPYIVTFMMFTPVDPTATEDNETITRVFNSFHVLGERPTK